MTKFNIIVDAISFISVFYGGFFAAYKAWKDWLNTRIAEADRKSQAAMIKLMLKDIEELKECQKRGDYSEREMRILVDRLIEDLKFLMQQLFENALPKKTNKQDLE